MSNLLFSKVETDLCMHELIAYALDVHCSMDPVVHQTSGVHQEYSIKLACCYAGQRGTACER